MGKLSEFGDRWFGRIANAYSLLPLLPALGVGVITGALSHGANWMVRLGPFGWWISSLLGFLIYAITMALLGLFWEKRSASQAMKKWEQRTPDGINPLDVEFHRKRIRFSDLPHPASNRISNKRFTDCELIGPANILLLSSVSLTGIGFFNCDFIPTKTNTFIFNTIGLENSAIHGGSISNTTIFVHPSVLAVMEQAGHAMYYPTLTGDPVIDSRVPGDGIAQR